MVHPMPNPIPGADPYDFSMCPNKEKIMFRTALFALAGFICAPALAVGSLADVNIIDRDTGQRLQAHYHKGEYWVAGRPGANYAIHIQSRNGGRLLAVTSVDGVNVLSGETAGMDQTGYVFYGWQGYDIAGWRKSKSEIAAFNFTSIPKSYAARTGRKENIGVIGVALFRERYVAPPPPVGRAAAPAAPRVLQERATDEELEETNITGTRIQQLAEGSGTAKADRAAPAPAPSLGTGHGRREQSVIVDVPFERAQSTPDEVIRIRYDSRDNLVAMGVLAPTPHPRPLDPFPSTPHPGYVPDP
jgi:hypothetical protein